MADTATLMMTMENGDDGGGSDGLILVTPCLPTPPQMVFHNHVPESLHLSSDSDTILTLSAHPDIIEVVVVLVDRVGAMCDMPDASNETALLKAAYNECGPNHKDRDGWTALHNCASRGFYRWADVNAQSGTGFTPLMNAASKGFIDIIQLLLTSYADPVIKNSYGDSAYDLAAQSEESLWVTLPLHRPRTHSRIPTVFLFSTSRFSPDNLTRHDRPAWTRASTNEECRLQDVGLPRDWIDLKHPGVDGDGWEYAREVDGLGEECGGICYCWGWVRRRRWIRVRKMRVDADSIGEGTRGGTEADYIVRAELALESLRSAVLKAVSPIVGRPIQILLSGIKSDTDNERKTKASEIVLSYLTTQRDQRADCKARGKSSGAGGSLWRVVSITEFKSSIDLISSFLQERVGGSGVGRGLGMGENGVLGEGGSCGI
ncbi:hypothetical protein BC829DRAFT_391142 [Chytridium lagenaria]|nr:hypothetical protein BC829DRAFT_391142 [Chytridium lagenaria]